MSWLGTLDQLVRGYSSLPNRLNGLIDKDTRKISGGDVHTKLRGRATSASPKFFWLSSLPASPAGLPFPAVVASHAASSCWYCSLFSSRLLHSLVSSPPLASLSCALHSSAVLLYPLVPSHVIFSLPLFCFDLSSLLLFLMYPYLFAEKKIIIIHDELRQFSSAFKCSNLAEP